MNWASVAVLLIFQSVTASAIGFGVMIGWRARGGQDPIVLPSLPPIRRAGGEKKTTPTIRPQENI